MLLRFCQWWDGVVANGPEGVKRYDLITVEKKKEILHTIRRFENHAEYAWADLPVEIQNEIDREYSWACPMDNNCLYEYEPLR